MGTACTVRYRIALVGIILEGGKFNTIEMGMSYRRRIRLTFPMDPCILTFPIATRDKTFNRFYHDRIVLACGT